MDVHVSPDPAALGRAASAVTAAALREAIEARGEAFLIVATGASQFEMLRHLVEEPGIDWSKVTAFHLDEYVGMPDTHPASFRNYLRERFVAHVPGLRAFHEVCGDAEDPEAECRRLDALMKDVVVDVACIGIGENGHLAFNDPPADVETEAAFLVVDLDEGCRRQQLGEGWFDSLDEVPRQAISMSVKKILASKKLVASVPDQRKAEAVRKTLHGAIVPLNPGAYLRTHDDCHLFLDRASASLLSPDEAEPTV